MTRLTLLLPDGARFAGTVLPASLAAVLGRADRSMSATGEAAQLSRYFQPVPARWSYAALTRVADATLDDAASGCWLRADPAHIRPDINGARLLGIGRMLGLDASDSEALLPALRPMFGDAGFELSAPHPTRWYVRLPREAQLPSFATPEQALGDDVFAHRADGAAARRWRALESEVQITLHNHPHNAARLAAGRVAINSLWFWGGGVLPDSMTSAAPTLYSDDALLRGVAAVGKLSCMPMTHTVDFEADGLLDLRAQRDPAHVLEQWLMPTMQAARRCDVVLDFADGTTLALRPNQRWRFWRKPLAHLG